ncbi:LOW QUALITY PROTEIN: hypothetical protein TorRG33x02_255480 [Trema orientale]|uniref:Uncharacterized protein n=1 Tax=Trema orientale TaxID=63057 RepID=A0A2P5DCN0_TREOI|nr:LOW QUALITY PROTEIN: hypothetical protein TorRG33x02_255480 [Trema orientale]
MKQGLNYQCIIQWTEIEKEKYTCPFIPLIKEEKKRKGDIGIQLSIPSKHSAIKLKTEMVVNPHTQFVLKKNNQILFAGIASSSSIIDFSQLSREGKRFKERKKEETDLGSRFLGNLLSLGNDLLNTSNHVERLFRKIIIFTIQNTLPTTKT